MEEILQQQLVVNQNAVLGIDLQTEQLFEIETVLRDLRSTLDTGIVELFSVIDDNIKAMSASEKITDQIVELGKDLDNTISVGVERLVEVLVPRESDSGYVLTREDFIENQRREDKTIGLLEQLVDNSKTSGATTEENKNSDSWISSFVGAAMGGGFLSRLLGGFKKAVLAVFSVRAIGAALSATVGGIAGIFGLGGILGNFGTAIKGLFSSSVFTKFLGPVVGGLFRVILAPINMILGMFMGLRDAVNEYMENGDIVEAVKAFFGGLINWFSFGIIDKDFSLNSDGWVAKSLGSLLDLMTEWIVNPTKQWLTDVGASIRGIGESITSWISQTWNAVIESFAIIPETFNSLTESISSGIANIGTFISESVIEPVIKLFTDVIELFQTYVSTPIIQGIESLGRFVRENVIEPIVDAFTGIRDFVVDLKDKVLGIFDNFAIPEVSFTIPYIDKKISMGPWYPFRSDKKEESSNAEVSEPTGKSAQTDSESKPLVHPESLERGKYETSQELTFRRVAAAKRYTGEELDHFDIAAEKRYEADKKYYEEQEANQKAGITERTIERADLQNRVQENERSQAEILKPSTNSHEEVYAKSAEAEQDKQVVVMPSTNVVAPVNNTTVNTTNNSIKVPVRNNDSTLKRISSFIFG